MSDKEYAKFLRAIGHNVIKTENAWWYDSSPRVYRGFPFHRPLELTEREIAEVLSTGALAVRYACPLEKGSPSYIMACRDKGYGIKSLPKPRNVTRRGLEACTVRQLTFDDLRTPEVMEMNRDTLERQGAHISDDLEEFWDRYYSAAKDCATMETWGAFVGDEIAAYLIACRIEDSMEAIFLKSRTKYLSARPNNALVYTHTQNALSRPEINVVSHGWEPSMGDSTGVERFKHRLGYKKEPIGQRIELNHLAAFFLRGKILNSVQRLIQFLPDRDLFMKMGRTLDWYAQQPR
jgi:hypothetical protein